jgi:citrate lyase subunit beta-like protein
MRSRRAILYVPGDDLHKIEKAATLGVDCVCLDLEDAVAAGSKEAARTLVASALHGVDFGSTEVLVRINSPGRSALADEDLTEVLAAGPHGILLPKVESSDTVLWADEQISRRDIESGQPGGSTGLFVMIETARGVLNLESIASSSPRLQALIFGGEDFLTDIGGRRTPERMEVFHARAQVILAAAAYDLQAIDMIYVDFRDQQGLLREALQGAQMGFAGKQVIHPAQVEVAQAAFTPTDDEIAWAERIITTFDAHQRQGRGVFVLDGRLVELPHIKSAHSILARARAAGIRR